MSPTNSLNPLPVAWHPESPATGSAAAPPPLPSPPGEGGVAASSGPGIGEAVDPDMTVVWQYYGQACFSCGRVFGPDDQPDTDSLAIPGVRRARRRCRTRCRAARADRTGSGDVG